MLKVFLAEDEYVVREGIKNNVDWAAHGYEFCGEASDGELAFPMIQRLKPDIVITDIKMPFMDGLELSRMIKKEFPWIEIVILSGYAEFDYAKEAISIGVAHYLTKPISGDELLKEIDELSDKIEEKKQELKLKEKYIQEMAENYDEDRRKLFQHMVLGDMSVAELNELAKGLEMDIMAGCYNIILMQLISSHHTEAEYSGSVVALYEQIEGLALKSDAVVFDRNLEGKAILLKADTLNELNAIQDELTEKIQGLLSDYGHVSYYAGIGTPVGRLTEIPRAYETAAHAYAHRYFTDRSEFKNYTEPQRMESVSDEEFSISSVNPSEIDRNRVAEFLRKGGQAETEFFIEEFVGNIGESALRSNMFRQYLAMDVYFAVGAFLESLGHDRSEVEAFNPANGDIDDVDRTVTYLTDIIDKAITIRDSSASNKYNAVIDEVKNYIDANYGDEELSLNKLASHVNFSPNHLSMIFSAQTGMTFIRYLTDLRMNKAMELLRCTSKRSVDISAEVGYKDPHYFSYLFKKTVGVTPTQYRADAEGHTDTH